MTDGEIVLHMEPPRPEIVEEAREELKQEAERIYNEDEVKKKREELIESALTPEELITWRRIKGEPESLL